MKLSLEISYEHIGPLRAALEEYCNNHNLYQCNGCRFLRADGSCIQEATYASIRNAEWGKKIGLTTNE